MAAQPANDEVIPLLLEELTSWFLQLKRTTAGYDALHGGLMAATNQVPEGQRKRCLPIFEFSAPLAGKETREVIKCAIDLHKIDPQYIAHVLIPLVNFQASSILEALEEISERINLLRPLLLTATGQAEKMTKG